MRLCRAITLGVCLLPVAMGLATGCDKDDGGIKQYEVAHVDDTPAGGDSGAAPAAPANAAPIQWNIPAGWRQLPGNGVRYASFAVSADHPDLQLTVIPLPGGGGSLLSNVNRWENQLGLPPSSQDDLAKRVTRIDAAGTPIDLFDRTGDAPADHSQPKRILAAIADHGNLTWFFKLTGPADQVQGQASNFADFIRSIRFTDTGSGGSTAAANSTAPPAPPAASADAPIHYSAPAGWTVEPVSPDNPFRVAAFTIPGQPDGGEVVATHVMENSGTLLDNINRWRGQIALDPLSDPSEAPAQTLPNPAGDANVWTFDNPGTGQSMRVAMISHGGQWWIFKLTGPMALVTQQKGVFDPFVSSVRFAGDSQ
jgi:hypothetical protein